ncbi:phenol acid carboxylase [Aspergillus saccharolyticus JOP 1030-1]|uniref:Phenol acid carboxylase n=1 Tax=Aspergillus saccharolyticus JOP 1030-1 TaxID=1450539 RepID=A0A319AAR9_9EURO|nr:phenol acid carboxylase [Aspergillus saccharolyticus JOP 1030-1]PYH44032.1 phenol acid carboxylase [Aspergillus saccharolyticus JOP 1030-1]
MPVLPQLEGSTFNADLRDRHIIHDNAAHDRNGNPEKWRYEIWFFNEDRVIYAIHGGPMADRKNFQAATYQCIRFGELWQVNWQEETGTICSLVLDIPNQRLSTLLGFSKRHWRTENEAAHGDKRNAEDFARWRELAKIESSQADRILLSEQAEILEDSRGVGDLEPIDLSWQTL